MFLGPIRERFLIFCRMIKIEHSIFALPFAYMGAFLAAGGWPGFRVFLFLTLAMVAIRSYAMAFNRIADLPIDRENPRTQDRPLVTGGITRAEAWIFTAAMGAGFVISCAFLNRLCLFLSPIALFWSAMYSLTKRFTYLSHFVLGSVLGLAPIAGWIAFQPSFGLIPFLLFFGVLFWVAGFDILYSCQDMEFDEQAGLHSVPVVFGIRTSLVVSSFSHVNASLFFLLAGLAAGLDWIFLIVWAVISGVLFWEHALIKEDDLSKVNLAFFTLNGFVAVALFIGVLTDLFL